MSDYILSTIDPGDQRAAAQLDALLEKEGIRRDSHLDHIVGLYDQDYNLAATGACFGPTLRCMAVDAAHQGEGLMSQVVSELMEFQCRRGNTHLFLYTKCSKAATFGDLGFYEIARAEGQAVLMENRRTGFSDYLAGLAGETAASGRSGAVRGAVVLNANPFTLGHQHLLEIAAQGCDVLHVFVVSEDVSLVPFAAREQLVRDGSAHLRNLVYHRTGDYMISSATFPSYFLKDSDDVTSAHARLDVAVFVKIARALGISRRFVGEEPFSHTTSIYNQIMERGLAQAGVALTVVPRKSSRERAISASHVRELLRDGNFDALASLVPESTLRFFSSPQAAPILARIRAADNVVHH